MKETINFVFNENEVPNRATAYSLTTGEKQVISKNLFSFDICFRY